MGNGTRHGDGAMINRRAFLQSLGAAVAAMFVPAVAAKAAEKYEFTQVLSPMITVTDEYLTEAALENAIIEINEFQSKTGKRIAFEPTLWVRSDESSTFTLMAGG